MADFQKFPRILSMTQLSNSHVDVFTVYIDLFRKKLKFEQVQMQVIKQVIQTQ
jgi:hypothetical protein